MQRSARPVPLVAPGRSRPRPTPSRETSDTRRTRPDRSRWCSNRIPCRTRVSANEPATADRETHDRQHRTIARPRVGECRATSRRAPCGCRSRACAARPSTTPRRRSRAPRARPPARRARRAGERRSEPAPIQLASDASIVVDRVDRGVGVDRADLGAHATRESSAVAPSSENRQRAGRLLRERDVDEPRRAAATERTPDGAADDADDREPRTIVVRLPELEPLANRRRRSARAPGRRPRSRSRRPARRRDRSN